MPTLAEYFDGLISGRIPTPRQQEASTGAYRAQGINDLEAFTADESPLPGLYGGQASGGLRVSP